MKKYIIVRDNAQYIAGTTLKAASQPEAFNMALHACKSEEAVLINRARFAKDLNIDAVPEIVVNGKYVVNMSAVNNEEELIDVIGYVLTLD